MTRLRRGGLPGGRDLAGKVLVDQMLQHVYRIRGGLIERTVFAIQSRAAAQYNCPG